VLAQAVLAETQLKSALHDKARLEEQIKGIVGGTQSLQVGWAPWVAVSVGPVVAAQA